MADHIFRHKTSGIEHLFDASFAKTSQAEEFEDLGEGVNIREDGRNIAVLVADLKKKEAPAAKGADGDVDKPKAKSSKKAKASEGSDSNEEDSNEEDAAGSENPA
jgi:hypothetical protein